MSATTYRCHLLALHVASLLTLFSCSQPAPPPPPPEPVVVVPPQPEPLPEPQPAPEPPAAEGEGEGGTTAPEVSTASAPAEPAPPEPAPEEKKPVYLENGMTYEAVKAMYGSPGQMVSGTTPGEGVSRWQLEGGASVQVRFRNGVVDRFTRYAPEKQAAEDTTPQQQITRAQYDQIAPGMTLYEVCESLDIEAKLMATGADGEKVYRWTDAAGASFGARFEGDKLVRKTALIEPAQLAQMEDSPGPVQPEAELAPEELPTDEMTEGEGEGFYEGEGEGAPPEDPRPRLPSERVVYTSRAPAGEISEPTRRDAAAGQVSRAEGRVRVVGRSAKEQRAAAAGGQEETYRERRQRARLPEFRHSLRKGVYEVRVRNESGGKVEVGLRQGKNGRDLSVGNGASASFQVDRGSYDLYYIQSDAPYSLQKGSAVNVDGQFEADLEIVINEEGATVSHLDTPIFY